MGTALGYATNVAIAVGILFVMIVVGAVIGKCKLVGKEGRDQMVNILMYIVTPALIIKSFTSVSFSPETIIEIGISAGCALLTHVVAILIMLLFPKDDERRRTVFRFCVIFANGGFMGLPMAQALVGDHGVLLVSMYVIVFNIVTWTYGVSMFKEYRGGGKLKVILNPGIIGVTVGAILFFTGIHLPEIISEPIRYISDLNTPLAMIVTGLFLIDAQLKDDLKDKKLWLCLVCRLVVVPFIMLVIFKHLFGLSGDLLICCLIPASAPCAVNSMMFSAKFGGDVPLACKLLSISTALSIITMPLVLTLAQI